MSKWVDFVHRVARRPPRLPVQVVALDEDGVVRVAADPDVALADEVQLDALADVQARALARLGAVHVAERAQAEAVSAGRVHVAVDRHGPPAAGHLERLAHL